MSDLGWLSATELLTAYRRRSLSPVEVTTALLDRIARLDRKVNAFCLVDHDRALADARASEARWVAGRPQGRLDGVPTGIKDLLLTKGWPTLRGSLSTSAAQAWEVDAPSVARLREHGAILLGKTTTPEFGWKGVTDNPLTGITRNPWDLTRTPGGSSGGASAALAAGFVPIAPGTDGGGSIRIPASLAGVVGHKPSFGRVPAYPASPFGTVAHVGPMTRTVADAALMLTVMAEPDARDWYALPYEARDFSIGLNDGVRGLRIAYSPRLGYVTNVQPEVAAAVASAARMFEALGAQVDEVDPGFADPAGLFRTLWWSGAAAALGDLPPERKAKLDPGLAHAVEGGLAISKKEYIQATLDRAALGASMNAFHQTYDLLLTPATSVVAFAAGQLAPDPVETKDWVNWTPFSFPFNLTQQPAISVPCGFTEAGLPIGLQLVGSRYDDALVLRAARAYEAATSWSARRPDFG
ncbi:amidase [Zavarzinia sp. CC-PAN008]|uniref:amidase n=1 Tax=Zavarzinia sp. CC-PAN008 TaxID=3243332 RepID=UPI003F74A85F